MTIDTRIDTIIVIRREHIDKYNKIIMLQWW